jgi:hypothetical protein
VFRDINDFVFDRSFNECCPYLDYVVSTGKWQDSQRPYWQVLFILVGKQCYILFFLIYFEILRNVTLTLNEGFCILSQMTHS